MHPDECRSTHLLLLPPTLLRSITWRPVKVNNLHTIHNDPPPSTQSWERFAKSFQSFSFNFPPLSFSSKNSLRKIHSPLRTHTRYIILIFRLSSSSPSQFSLTVIIHHPSILLRTLPQRNLVAPLHGALFHSPIPGELSVSVRHTGWMPKRSSTGSTGEAVWLIPWRGLARIRQDPLWRRVWDEAGRNRVPRETRGGRDRPTRDVSPLPPRPTANGHPRLAPPSTWRTVDTAAFNRWRCAVSPSLFHHGRLSPLSLSLSLSVRLLLSLSQSRHSHDCRASDYRNHRRLFSRLFCSMVNSRPADIGALLSETIGAGIDSFSALGRVASGTGLPRGGRVLEFRGRWNWRKLFRGGREMME